MELSKLLNVVGFLQISTLYVNSREKMDDTIYEEIYNQGFDTNLIFMEWLKSNKKLDDSFILQIKSQNDSLNETQRLKWPNHYTLTKNMAEQTVSNYCNLNQMRFSIARLGIIGPFRNTLYILSRLNLS